eukprot:2037249-Pyramimonas_sp.AAC.1
MHIGTACATVAIHLQLGNARAQDHRRANVRQHMHHVAGSRGTAKCLFAEHAANIFTARRSGFNSNRPCLLQIRASAAKWHRGGQSRYGPTSY